MQIKPIDRKSRVLTRSQFGCLRNGYTINVARGCTFGCVYCYARGYPDAPPSGSLEVYRNLPAKLAAELDNPRRRIRVAWVSFNTATDCFQQPPELLATTYGTMQILLERGIGFSFLTKGWIPERFLRLFAARPRQVRARIGLVSVAPEYQALFEPQAAAPAERLHNIERLQAAGLVTDVRIDPIIPFITDSETAIHHLFTALARRGITSVSLSYLHLRPAIYHQLRHEVPAGQFALLRTCFETAPWVTVGAATRSKLIPLPLRRKGYQRFRHLARQYGITPYICECKNPDLPGQRCTAAPDAAVSENQPAPQSIQLPLFPD